MERIAGLRWLVLLYESGNFLAKNFQRPKALLLQKVNVVL